MNINSYLLLDCVSELEASINQVISGNFEELFNLPSHNLSDEEVMDELDALYSKGLIYVKESGGKESKVLPSKCSNKNEYIGLTALGGQKWESFFNPDWNKFISIEVDEYSEKNPSVDIRCSDKNYLEEFLHKLKIGDCKISEIRPWKANYWKTLEVGFICTFSTMSENLEESSLLIDNQLWRKVWDISSESLKLKQK